MVELRKCLEFTIAVVLPFSSALGCYESDAETDPETLDRDGGGKETGDSVPTPPPCGDDCPEASWIEIPAGVLWMGSDMEPDEGPVHEVNVPAFEMLKSEVTVAQYEACVKDGSCDAPDDASQYCDPAGVVWSVTGEINTEAINWGRSDRADHPVQCVDFDDSQAFCIWIGGDLPSEAEWEHAARDANSSVDGRAGCDAVWAGCEPNTTNAVCQTPEGDTAQGLCDMLGNVSEWVLDYYHDSYRGAPADGSAWIAPPAYNRVHRGGSLISNTWETRATDRGASGSGMTAFSLGFRCVRK